MPKVITPPHDSEIERQIIHLCIKDKETITKFASKITKHDFYNMHNQQTFEIILNSYQKNGIIDYEKITGASYYFYHDELRDEIPYVNAGDIWIDKLCVSLKELAKKRALLSMSHAIQNNLAEKQSNEIVNTSMSALTIISDFTQTVKTDAQTIAKRVLEYWVETKEKTLIGASTGFIELDELIGGFQKGHIWIVGGYTNYGKTTLAISFLSHLIKNNQDPFLFCSIEMSQNQIFEKLISNITHETNGWNKKNYNLPVVKDALKKVSESQLEITDDITTVQGIILKIQEMTINKKKPLVVFIDFIQNIQGEGYTEYERITNAIREIQIAARRLDVCIVVLSQVNNQSAVATEVMGFKSSGALAAAGDITLQVVRDKKAEVEAAINKTSTEFVEMKVIVQKNRHGRCGGFALDFDTTKGLIVNH